MHKVIGVDVKSVTRAFPACSNPPPIEGLIQAGKIRRSRPVLPSGAERRKLDSSSADGDNGLPPGCTIVNRNPNAILAESSTAGRVSDTDAAAWRKGKAKPVTAAVGKPSEGVVATGTRRSSVVDVPAAAYPSGACTTQPQQRRLAVRGSSRGSAEKSEPAAAGSSSKPSAFKQAWGSAEAFLESIASIGGASERDEHPRRRVSSESLEQQAAPAPWRKAVPAEKKGSTPISRSREASGGNSTPVVKIPLPATPLPSPREITKKVVPSRSLRYNPGPTFRETRGRKKKALLDPSEITEDNVVGTEELNALLADPALQQV